MSPSLLEVGRVVKPHGILGEVIVYLSTERTERVRVGSRLTGSSPAFDGTVELTINASRPHQGRWIVAFDGWATRDAAEILRGTVLSAPPLEDPDTIWVHLLIGSTVIDQHGVERGKVVAVEANPASDLMVLESGTLVPVHFVVSTEQRRVLVDVPEGLFE